MSETRADPREEAVARLRELGLSSYAARTFVALAAFESATARDVSEAADVPRTRVYDAVSELRDHGLVDVKQATPKEFTAVSPQTTRWKFERDLTDQLEALQAALETVGPDQRVSEQAGVFTVDGTQTVEDRVLEFISSAAEEIVYMCVEELLNDAVIDSLAAASDRGVRIYLGGISPAVQADIQETVPDAELYESLWLWSDTPAGRLLMVDGSRALVSVLLEDVAGTTERSRGERAIWGAGPNNSFVVVLEAIFTWRLAEGRDPSA